MFGMNLGLSRIRELSRLVLGPLPWGPRFIQVAGTNGKGSAAAILAAMIGASGQDCGLFTSPHLEDYRERCRIGNSLISREDFAFVITELAPLWQQMADVGWDPPTEFEVSTAAALRYFQLKDVPWAVMEAGLGGELDSTNVVPGEIAIITNIGHDHNQYLGETLTEIARAKAGIIKPGALVITGAKGKALEVIRAKAKEQNSGLLVLGEDFDWSQESFSELGQYFSWSLKDRIIEPHKCEETRKNNKCDLNLNLKSQISNLKQLFLPLLGRHQLDNAVLALAAGSCLGLPEAALRQGLAQVSWPGRLEIVGQKPLLLLDGAHNPEGMAALARSLAEYWPRQRKIGLIGMLDDKAIEEALTRILPQLDTVIITRPSDERAENWQKLEIICHDAGRRVLIEEDVALALAKAKDLAQPKDMIVVCGSLYLVGEVKKICKSL
ncbi:MAG: bifunctional folylpolyglutamate synthase/dihydrofolate synthase [Clostridiales bacterium]|nr:bifunctional folylpolyglutamate synthase/dihydrofolate synthase [Clostridiales bacterium]